MNVADHFKFHLLNMCIRGPFDERQHEILILGIGDHLHTHTNLFPSSSIHVCKLTLKALYSLSSQTLVRGYPNASKQNNKEHNVHTNKGLSLLFPEMKMH